jgi:hypothetical protein
MLTGTPSTAFASSRSSGVHFGWSNVARLVVMPLAPTSPEPATRARRWYELFERLDVDAVVGGQDDKAADDVLKLPNIAGPVTRDEPIHRRPRKREPPGLRASAAQSKVR